jgi:hypothetical protein
MFNSIVLDVAIGLVFAYLILGLMCTTVNEWIAGIMNLRAKNLEEGIRRLLTAPPDGTQLLRSTDLKDPGKLLLQLQSSNDPLPAYIRSQFDPVNLQLINSYSAGQTPIKDVIDALCKELNKQIQSRTLFDQQRFPQTTIAPDQLAKALQDPEKMQELNRNLLQNAFSDSIGTFADEFYGHPLIKALIPKSDDLRKWRRFLGRKRPTSVAMPKKAHPSYVPARTFALSIMDIVIKGQQGPTSFKQLLDGINALPDSDVKQSLLALMQNTDHTLDAAQQRIEGWFNDAMDRVSGWYKRKTQIITVIVAALIILFANADTIQIANKLFMTPAVREAFVTAAKNTTSSNTSVSQQLTAADKQLLTALSGWTDDFGKFDQIYLASCSKPGSDPAACAAAQQNAAETSPTFPGFRFFSSSLWPWLAWLIPQHIVGWILSAIAVSLGAPFWFDTLNRFMNIRNSGKSPDEGPKGPAKNVA